MGGAKKDVASKALKPGAVSCAPEWATSRQSADDMQGFKTVKKGGGGGQNHNNNNQWKPQNVPVSTSSRPAEKKFVPQGYVVGASVVEKAPQAKPKAPPKPKQQKQEPLKTSWDEDEDAGWATVGVDKKAGQAKPAAAVKEAQKSDKQIKNEENWKKKKAIKEHNQSVVGAVPVNAEEEKRRQQKEAKEAKKRMQELAKQQQAREAEKLEASAEGFKTVMTGAKASKGKKQEKVGEKTAFSGLVKEVKEGQGHRKPPKPMKEREVRELTEEEKQEVLRKTREALTAKPKDSDVGFKIQIQGTWYPIKQLLETKDFEHAPKLVAAACGQEKVIGGFFIGADNKSWSNEATVDELWMATSYISGLTKLLNTMEPVSITPYWPSEKGGKDATTVLQISRPTLQAECYPTMTMSHSQKQATALQDISVSVHQFAAALIAEARLFEKFIEKLHEAGDKLGENKKWQGKGKQQQIKDFLSKLPTKVDSLAMDLEYALKEFTEKHPLPDQE